MFVAKLFFRFPGDDCNYHAVHRDNPKCVEMPQTQDSLNYSSCFLFFLKAFMALSESEVVPENYFNWLSVQQVEISNILSHEVCVCVCGS